jgi:hypothetical protein
VQLYLAFMKPNTFAFVVAGTLSVLAGCASRPISLSTVGPEPIIHDGITSSGYLQVFSKTVMSEVGDDTYYYPHVGYNIYDKFGKRLKYVPDQIDNFDESPTLMQLPQGNYNIVTLSESYGRVIVPVVIQAGRTTIVHLDKDWKPSSNISTNALVRLPNGEAVGWSSVSNAFSE